MQYVRTVTGHDSGINEISVNDTTVCDNLLSMLLLVLGLKYSNFRVKSSAYAQCRYEFGLSMESS